MKNKSEYFPSEKQKARMYKNIIEQVQSEDTFFPWVKRMVIDYPWRMAFGISAMQGILFTLLLGTRYSNLFLSAFGG